MAAKLICGLLVDQEHAKKKEELVALCILKPDIAQRIVETGQHISVGILLQILEQNTAGTVISGFEKLTLEAQLGAAQAKLVLQDILTASMTSAHLDEITSTNAYAQKMINAATELRVNHSTSFKVTWESNLWQEYATIDPSRKEKTHVQVAFEKLSQAVDAAAVWEFVDTHASKNGVTQDFLMCRKGCGGAVTSAGLVVELTGQNEGGSSHSDFPTLSHLGKLHRDMLRVLRRRGWKGFVHAVITDLSRIVCFRMAMGADGTIDSVTIQRTPLEHGAKVKEHMIAFLNHTPGDLGVGEEFTQSYQIFLGASSNTSTRVTKRTLTVDKVLGTGAQGVVYRVNTEGHQDCCLKVFRGKDVGFKRELEVLRELAGVHGVTQLRGQNKTQHIIMLSPVCKRPLESYRNTGCVEGIGRQLVTVLQSVHQRGFAYRDMRGSNVLVEEERVESLGIVQYRVYLSDFGMAVPLDQERAYEGTVRHAARAVLDILSEHGVHAGVTCTAATDLESLVKMTWCLSQPLGLTLIGDPVHAKEWWSQMEAEGLIPAERLGAARASEYAKLATAV